MQGRRDLGLGVYSGILWLILCCGVGLAQESRMVLMEVSGTIDLGLAPYTRRVLQEAETLQATAVILRINTPGGRVDAAMQMRDALLDTPVDTIAFID